jgi:hypothetical protein
MLRKALADPELDLLLCWFSSEQLCDLKKIFMTPSIEVLTFLDQRQAAFSVVEIEISIPVNFISSLYRCNGC